MAYFSNPSFPFKDNLTNYLTYTIKVSFQYVLFCHYYRTTNLRLWQWNLPKRIFFNKVTDPDVCQVRLDFEIFLMSGPDLTSNQPPYGRCRGDRLAIFTKKQDLGLSEGNLLCGDMTGQHSKYDFSLYIKVNIFMPFKNDFRNMGQYEFS